MLASLSRRSFAHREFDNPEAETCWLSCLFQSLWHSVVFHTNFERHLAPPSCRLAPSSEPILVALQETWAEYVNVNDEEEERRRTAHQDVAGENEFQEPIETELRRLPAPTAHGVDDEGELLVPADGLVDGFGMGYGDMAEAFACVQDALSKSTTPGAAELAELLVIVPMHLDEDSWPSPVAAWKQACEWQATGKPIIAVDLSVQAPTREDSGNLARIWVPSGSSVNGDANIGSFDAGSAEHGDMGHDHVLVALVCYMWNIRHYVAFCRRQCQPSRCIFFNDLPTLTKGAPREVAWREVPDMCYRYALTPRLALYESQGAAKAALAGIDVPPSQTEGVTGTCRVPAADAVGSAATGNLNGCDGGIADIGVAPGKSAACTTTAAPPATPRAAADL